MAGKRTKPRSKIKYIASVETSNNNRREQWAFGRDEHSLTCSGRWTDAKLFSTKKKLKKFQKNWQTVLVKKSTPNLTFEEFICNNSFFISEA